MTIPAANTFSPTGLRRHVPELAIEWQLDTPDERYRSLEGTLCFADVSGFTALAERLSRRGRVGGEELVETLGRVFSAMLDVVHARRGELLKFGGDALLLLFRGEDHAVQAASAAVEMRQVLRGARQIPTSVGPLALSMSMGVHSGAIDCFLIGTTHRELVLLGPQVNTVIGLETQAEPGQILVSVATDELLPAGATRPSAAGARQLRWRHGRAPAPGPKTPRTTDQTLLKSLLPEQLAAHLAPGVPDPEHRVACIAFAKFAGTDALLAQEGPVALARALGDTIGHIQAVLAQEGVTLLAVDVDRDGGKLFLASGVPFKHEDDEGAMLHALTRIASASLPLRLHFGVNRGHVFAAEVGASTRAAYSAMGDTTNTAARICAKAPAGVIYAQGDVLDECLTLYETRPSPPLTLKGKQAPLVVYAVGRQLGTRRREGLGLDEFVGRDVERNTLTGLFARAEQDGGAVACISGDTGMGKSTLIREVLRHNAISPVLMLRGEPGAGTSAYALLREPLQRLFGLADVPVEARADTLAALVSRIAPDHAPLLPLLGEILGVPIAATPETTVIDPQYRNARAAELLIELIARHHPGAQVWVVDDAQWSDESSSAILLQLARLCPDRSWLLIVSRRSGPGGFVPTDLAGVATIELGPMSTADLTRLIRLATEAAPLRPHELELVLARSDGNPMFALELLRAARDAGSFQAVPESLEGAMAARVDALDRDARRLLRYASVLGRSFSLSILATALAEDGQPVDAASLEALHEFLESEGDRVRFTSEVIRETVYQGVAFRQRRVLHRRIAEAMEQLAESPEDIADMLALHFSRAGEPHRVFEYARHAAARARARYANSEAAGFYRLALDAAEELDTVDNPTRIALLTSLGDVAEHAGELEASLDAYRRALKLAGNEPLVRSELLYSRATAKERMRALGGAMRDLKAALRLLAPLEVAASARMRARLETTVAWVLYGQDRLHRALAQARSAATLCRAVDERHSLGSALMIIDLCELAVTGPGDGQHMKEALDLFAAEGDLRMQASVKANLGFLCAVAGRWQEAKVWLDDARAEFGRIGDVIRSADPALNLGEMLVKQRRYDEAEPVLRDAIRLLRSTHFKEGVNRGEIQLARILIEREALEEAESMLSRVQREFDQAGQHLAALEAAAVRASGKRRAGAPGEALALIDRATRVAGDEWVVLRPVTACERSLALADLDRVDEALAEARLGLDAARTQGLLYEEALLLEILAALGAGEVNAARRILDSLGVLPDG